MTGPDPALPRLKQVCSIGKASLKEPIGSIGQVSHRPFQQGAADACREAIQVAREMGITVSCDLNYRAKLWKWGKNAGEVMSDLVAMCDVALGNEEDAEKVFGIKSPDVDVSAGKVKSRSFPGWSVTTWQRNSHL